VRRKEWVKDLVRMSFFEIVISKLAVGHVDDPVGRKPLENVVVAGDGDEAALDLAAAYCLGNGGGADLGDIAVDDAGKFIERNDGRMNGWRGEEVNG